MVEDKVDHVALLVAIARLEGKVDALNERLGEKHQRDTVLYTDHEKRIRHVEQNSWRLSGLASVVAALVSGAVVYFKGGA